MASEEVSFENEPRHEKTGLSHMQITKAQISLRIQNFKTLASFCSRAGHFVSYLVANTEDRFSRDVAQMLTDKGRMMTDTWLYYKVTYEPSAQVS